MLTFQEKRWPNAKGPKWERIWLVGRQKASESWAVRDPRLAGATSGRDGEGDGLTRNPSRCNLSTAWKH